MRTSNQKQRTKEAPKMPSGGLRKENSSLLESVRKFWRSSKLSMKFGNSATQGEEAPRSVWQKWRHVIANIVLALVGWGVLFGYGLAGWPGESASEGPEWCYVEPHAWGQCFCERLGRDAIIKQPANTYTNLFYALGGLIIAFCADTRKYPSFQWWENANLMTFEVYFSMAYSLLLTNKSYTSAMLHAGWTLWTETVDIVGMLMIFSWILWFSITKFALYEQSCQSPFLFVGFHFGWNVGIVSELLCHSGVQLCLGHYSSS